MTLADGSTWRAAALRLTADETSWIAEGDVLRVPTCAVASLRALPRTSPRPGRIGRGVVGGGVAGAVVGAVMAGSVGCGIDSSPNAGCMAAAAALVGAAGALVGLGLDVASQPRAGRRREVTLAPSCAGTVVRHPLAE